MNDEATPGQTSPSFFFIFPSVMLPMFLAVIDQTIVASALPAIATSLGGVERVSWIVVAYLLATTVAAPVYGNLRDTLGGRNMMLLSLAIFIVSSALCAASTSMEMLAVCRVLQGIGGGGLMTLSQALVGEAVPALERARYQGYLAAVAVTSSALGPVIGGVLTEHFGWRSIFLINIPVGFLAIALTLRLPLRPASTEAHRFDWNGLGLFILFIVPGILAIEQLPALQVRGLVFAAFMLALAALGLHLLIRHEARTEHPLFDLDLLRRPTIWRSAALAACHGASLVSLISFLPIYFHIHFGMSASHAGLLLLPMMFGIGLGSMITGRLVGRTGQTMIFPSFGLIATVILALQLSLWADRVSESFVLVLVFLLGMSMGTVMGVVQVVMQVVAGREHLGAAASTVQVARSIGAAGGTAIVGAVLFATLGFAGQEVVDGFSALVHEGAHQQVPAGMEHIRTEILHAFRVAFFAIAAFTGIALLLAWTHPHRRI